MTDTNEDPYITASQLERVMELFIQAIEKRWGKIEERLDSLEKLHAKLALAYAELGSSVEAIITEIMSPRSEEEKAEFRKAMNDRFMQTLDMIQEVTHESAKQNSENVLDDALARLADKRQNLSSE